MTVIDATKKLTIRHFDKFEPFLTEPNAKLYVDDICVYTDMDKDLIIDIFKSAVLNGLDDTQIITLETPEAKLMMTVKDYKKWTIEWWANRIFKAKETKDVVTKVTKEALKIECFLGKRKLDGGNVYDEISIISSNRKDIIRFINENKGRLEIQARLENAEVVYLLRYVGEDNQFFRNEDELLLNGNFIM